MDSPQEGANLPSTIEVRKADSIELLREARPYLMGSPQVYSIRISYDPLNLAWLTEDMLRNIYFCRSSLRPTMLVIHDLPVNGGTLHVVTIYADHMLFPVEYAAMFAGRIPRSVTLRGKGWNSAVGGRRMDEFCRYLDQRVHGGSRFNLNSLYPFLGYSAFQRRIHIELPWTSQLIPLGDDQTLFLMQKPYMAGFLSSGGEVKFNIEKALQAREQVSAVVREFAYQGLPARMDALDTAVSLIAVPGITRRDGLALLRETWVVDAANSGKS